MRYNRDFEHWGESIKRSIQDAVDSGDFASLNQTIRNTINSAFGIGRSSPDMVDIDLGTRESSGSRTHRSQETNRSAYRTASTSQGYRPTPGAALFEKGQLRYAGTGGKQALAIVLVAVGYGLGGVLLLAFLIALAAGSIVVGTGLITIALGTLGGLIIPCAVMAAVGTRRLGRVKRFRLYVNTIKDKEYCNVKDLANRVMKSDKYVVKDLTWMLKNMWFLQGHLDEQNACLMTTDDAYREYCALMRQRQEQRKMESEKAAAEAAAAQSKKQSMDPQIFDMIQRGEAFIKQIRACNDAIPGEEVSAKIFRMETLTRRIFARVEEEPDTAGDIRKLMDYYLPTAVKLMEAYRDLDGQPVQGENIISSKKEIEDTLDTLNGAFAVLLDDMFQDMAWDVSADVSVLKTMLAQEGLTEKDFKTGGRK